MSKRNERNFYPFEQEFDFISVDDTIWFKYSNSGGSFHNSGRGDGSGSGYGLDSGSDFDMGAMECCLRENLFSWFSNVFLHGAPIDSATKNSL